MGHGRNVRGEADTDVLQVDHHRVDAVERLGGGNVVRAVQAVDGQSASGIKPTVDMLARLRFPAHTVLRAVERRQRNGVVGGQEVDGAS